MIERRPFVQKVLKNRQSNLRVVSGLGTSTWDLMSGVRVGGGRERVLSRRCVDAV